MRCEPRAPDCELESYLGSRRQALPPFVTAQQRGELAHVPPFLTAVDGLLGLPDALRREHDACELAELRAQLRLRERPQEIAPMALAFPRARSSILQRDLDARRPQTRRHGAHRRVLG